MDEEESKSSVPAGPALGPAYELWEGSLEKLKILHYETGYCSKGRKPFSRVHFVYPGSNAGVQFDEFVDICAWLSTIITRDEDARFKRDQYDDPNTVVNKLMLVLRGLGFNSSFPAQKLKTANGEQICGVIDFLADKALAARNFRWGVPVYSDTHAAESDQAEMDDNEAVDGEIEDETAGAVDDEVNFEEGGRGASDIAEVSLDSSAHHMLHALVDPIEWKTELERVGPKLRANQPLAANEWRSHVDQTVTSKGHIDRVMGETQGDLQSMNRQIAEELARMVTKEKYLNHQFSSLCIEFQEAKKTLEDLESKSGKTNDTVAKLTNELAELTEKLDDLKDNFESKDSGIHDTSPLVRIKAALQQIKLESCAFDLRIGVVSHNLLAARVNTTNRRRVAGAAKAKQRHSKKGHHHTEDTSLLSDD